MESVSPLPHLCGFWKSNPDHEECTAISTPHQTIPLALSIVTDVTEHWRVKSSLIPKFEILWKQFFNTLHIFLSIHIKKQTKTVPEIDSFAMNYKTTTKKNE